MLGKKHGKNTEIHSKLHFKFKTQFQPTNLKNLQS
jgi:hypothetical protein